MEDLSANELGQQLYRPNGKLGIEMGDKMSEANQVIYQFILSLIPFTKSDQILEIGCGNGKLLPLFFEKESEICLTAIDFSNDMVKAARKYNDRFIQEGRLIVDFADAANTSFRDNSFDFIITMNTVYFWDPFQKFINEIRRILKPAGKLLIGYRTKESLRFLSSAEGDFKFYRPGELAEVIKLHDLKFLDELEKVVYIKNEKGELSKKIERCIILEK